MANYMVNWFFLDDLAAVRGVSPAQRGAAWRCRRLGMQRVFTMVDGVADVCLCIIYIYIYLSIICRKNMEYRKIVIGIEWG